MTYRPAPRLELRSSATIAHDIRRSLEAKSGLPSNAPDPPVEALIQVFAYYWEIVASRLNQALDKNFLAFLDYAGVSPIAPAAAVVPLTFTAVENAPRGVVVPVRTQVSAAGGTEPVVFETMQPLAVTGAAVRHVFSLDPANNTQTDLAPVIDLVAEQPMPVMARLQPTEHLLFIGDDTVFTLEYITTLGVHFDIAAATTPVGMRTSLEWFARGPKDVPLVPTSDGTAGFRQSGDVMFQAPGPWPDATDVHSRSARWLGCRIVASGGNWTASATRIELRAEVKRTQVPIEAALVDTADVDLSKDFYPFGMRPVFGSTLYIASDEVLSRPGTKVMLDITLTNPNDAKDDPPIPRVYNGGHPRVSWEYWNGTRWVPLEVEDGTKHLRLSGSVHFEIPSDVAHAVVRGRKDAWVRARLASGHYGEDERWVLADPAQPAAGLTYRPATLAPPSIQTITASYSVVVAKVPDAIITSHERVYTDESAHAHAGRPVPLFAFPCGPRPALYFGVRARGGAETLDEPLTLLAMVEPIGPPSSRSDEETAPLLVDWQFWNGTGWVDFDVSDDTGAFTRSGAVTLVAPPDARPRRGFVVSSPLFWFRLVPHEGVVWHPALRALLRNTVLASQHSTVENEILGSSHAAPRQTFEALHRPVLEGELLQVREPASSPPSQHDNASRDVQGATGSGPGVWIEWEAVSDFLSSGRDDRHYVIDRTRGVIEFGDGQRGRIPPSGSNNVRLRRYASGGGARGNVAKGALNQLSTAVPYITAVANPIAAVGGADAEPTDRVRRRGARPLRHRHRAVTIEDHADLALLASPRVGRAECVPLLDLSIDPAARQRRPGLVSVIVIPEEPIDRPAPDAELLHEVRCHLDRCRNTSTDLVVVGPDYVAIDVEVEVAVGDASAAADVSRALKLQIAAFLHPLTGGRRGEGWPLGELPQRDELYALCASTPGVTWISALRVAPREDRAGVMRTGHFLPCSGTHRVSVKYTRELAASTRAGRSA